MTRAHFQMECPHSAAARPVHAKRSAISSELHGENVNSRGDSRWTSGWVHPGAMPRGLQRPNSADSSPPGGYHQPNSAHSSAPRVDLLAHSSPLSRQGEGDRGRGTNPELNALNLPAPSSPLSRMERGTGGEDHATEGENQETEREDPGTEGEAPNPEPDSSGRPRRLTPGRRPGVTPNPPSPSLPS